MRSLWTWGFALGVMLGCSPTWGGFVFTTQRAPITAGTFAGIADGVTLFVQNIGGDTHDTQFGNDLIYYDVTMNAVAGTVNPRFYIRTWDGNIRNTANPAANNQADFGYQGFVPGDANRDGKVSGQDFTAFAANFNVLSGATWEMGDWNGDGKVSGNDFTLFAANFNSNVAPGSYVRFGASGQFNQFFSLTTNPAENSQTYADGQTVPGFEVTALVLDPSKVGLDDSAATPLAFAVVPTGQQVLFSGSVSGHSGPAYSIPNNFTAALPASLTAVPEPAAIGLVTFGGLLLRRSRRKA